jgi:hypothetical protein
MIIRLLVVGSVLFTTLLAGRADAQGFISPFLGYVIGDPPPGLALCAPQINDCEDGRGTIGVSMGTLGRVVGFEFDIGYTKGYFGEVDSADSSSLLTVMSNLLIAPKFGPVQPYFLVGGGVLRRDVDFTVSELLETSDYKLAWDIGGGLMLFFGEHIGVRGDIRYMHAFQNFKFGGIELEGTKLDAARTSAAVVFKF